MKSFTFCFLLLQSKDPGTVGGPVRFLPSWWACRFISRLLALLVQPLRLSSLPINHRGGKTLPFFCHGRFRKIPIVLPMQIDGPPRDDRYPVSEKLYDFFLLVLFFC